MRSIQATNARSNSSECAATKFSAATISSGTEPPVATCRSRRRFQILTLSCSRRSRAARSSQSRPGAQWLLAEASRLNEDVNIYHPQGKEQKPLEWHRRLFPLEL